MQYLIGIVIGITLCYAGTLLNEWFDYYKMLKWLEDKDIDVDDATENQLKQYIIMYKLSKVPNVEIDVVRRAEDEDGNPIE